MEVEEEVSSEQITQGRWFQGEGAVCEKGGGWGAVWHMRRAASESLWLRSWGEMGMQASACILSFKKKSWKFLLKKIIYQIILLFMVSLGNILECTRSNLDDWRILKPLELLTVNYRAAESIEITQQVWTKHLIVSAKLYMLSHMKLGGCFSWGCPPWSTPASMRPPRLT